VGRAVRTNLSSRTACRSFSHIQCKWVIENIIEHVALSLNKPPHIICEKNIYPDTSCVSYNKEKDETWNIPADWAKLKQKTQFDLRFAEINKWNQANKWRKRGIYMTGVKYRVPNHIVAGMAHLTVYEDGSVLVIHGGADPGNGVNTKVTQAVSLTLGIPNESIRVGDCNTDITPKTGWNGGSAGIESTVEAVRLCCQKIIDRLNPYKLKLIQDSKESIEPTWKEIVSAATKDNITQTISEYYSGLGSLLMPHLQPPVSDYYTCGVSCSEVEVDILTGEVRIIRSDIFIDVGNTLNPLIDIGQSEGAFVFGLGYFLQEEELNSTEGKPLYASTWTYKPSLGVDIPNDFRVELADTSYTQNIMGFKGVGEPPMVLSYSVIGAIKQAILASRVERGLTSWNLNNAPLTIDKRSLAGEV